ncbi:MAG: sugar phosphate nucleotidyltransferase [Nocardioidaceae bacterium]
MEAVIVAGGVGSRLRPLTQFTPKHLLPVAGVPFAEHQVARLAAAGVARVVMATSYHADAFRPVLGDGDRWGVTLVYVREPTPLGTGGAIRNVADALTSGPDEPVLVLNGDILSDSDLTAQLARHAEASADVTLHLVEVADARPFGCVPTDSIGRVTAFVEKSPHPVSRQVNAGCYVFRRRVIDAIPAGAVVSVERETFPGLVAAGRSVVGYLHGGYWLDVGTPQALVLASADVVLGVVGSAAYPHPPAEHRVADDAEVARSATLSHGTSVGPGALVGPGAEVAGSVLCAGAVVERGAVVTDSVIGRGARVGAATVLRGSFLGDRSVVGAGCELVGGARVWGDQVIAPGAVRFTPDG